MPRSGLTHRIDPYDPVQPKVPYDQELFHAHMAQAFRYSRVSLFIFIPTILSSMGGSGVGASGDVLANIDWYAQRRDRTVEVAVSGAIQEKELGNA